MWNPFKRKAEPRIDDLPPVLFFKSTEAAYEYACEYMTLRLDAPTWVYGIVIKVYEGMKKLTFDVKLASEEGVILKQGQEVFTEMSADKGVQVEPIKLGDFVSVKIETYLAPERRGFPVWFIIWPA